MEILVVAFLIGLLPAAIAQSKGRSFIGWWIYGTLLFIVALPHSLIIRKREETSIDKPIARPVEQLKPNPDKWIES